MMKTPSQKIILLCLFSFLMTIGVQAQKTKAVLKFNDGKELSGMGKLIGKNRIKFRASKAEKAVKYGFDTLQYAELHSGDVVKKYVLRPVRGKNRPVVVEEVSTGTISLYRTSNLGYNPGFVGNGGVPNTGYTYNIKNFYVQKAGTPELVHLGSNQLFSKNFRKAASDFFQDCPELVEKIHQKTFKKRDLKKMIAFYNASCH